jgi:hypothetical protein
VRTPSAGTAPATGQKTASASAGGGSPNKTGGNPTGAATKSSSNTSGAKASGSAGTGEPADFSLDGKLVFAISGTFMLGTGLGGGGTITIWEKHSLRRFFSPSIFVTAKYFAIDDRKRFFAGGAGILFKRRLTRNERLLLNLGLSLEYLGGSVEHPRYPDYYEPIDFSSFGMGVQGGLSWRCTPNISLDLNGLVKFGFGSVNLDYVCAPDESYTPLAGGVELGITFMLPY